MFGFPWHLEPQYDLSKLDPVARLIQIRDDDNLAPKDLAKEYAVQMKQAEFPAIVVTSDTLLYIVDGNTRTAACAINGVKFFPAIVIEFPYIGASEKRQRDVRKFAIGRNQAGGQRVAFSEIRKNRKDWPRYRVKFFPAIVIEFPYIGVALTAYGKPALSGQLRLHLGWIINHSDRAGEFVEKNPANMKSMPGWCARSATCLPRFLTFRDIDR